MIDLDIFIRERNEALLSLDAEKIKTYMRKYDCPIPTQETLFWASVHKARTAVTTFSDEERQKSVDWLTERKLSHFRDAP